MQAGKLRKRILIQQRASTVESTYGQQNLSWSDLITVWADLEAISGAQLARSQSIPIWSWGQIMPQSCAGHQWTLDQPRLMADDHIHLTGEGYRRSAEAFVTFVMPVIDRTIRERNDAVPKH